jgi:Glyoxalase-like domain
MTIEFDHLFICTDIGAPEADRLIEFGLVEGSSNTHPGQGTANRRFFFHNAMLELLWVHDPQEAQSESIRQTRLCDRWENRQTTACPFGIILRSTSPSSDAVAFSSWSYHPPYLPETLCFAVGTNSDVLTEPLLFQISFGKRPDQVPLEKAQPLTHPAGLREITRVEIVSPATIRPSPELQALLDAQLVRLRSGTEYCVELGFDGELQNQQVDFRPGLPLMMSW